MAQITRNIEKVNSHVTVINTVITFRTQQLLDLFVNEMQGQISDGMWENSRNTEWLWQKVYLQLGSETKVEVAASYMIGRKSFRMPKELCEIVGERAREEAGYETIKDMVAGWNEIATAIKNVTLMSEETRKFVVDRDTARKAARKEVEEKLLSEIKENVGEKDFGTYQSYVIVAGKTVSIKARPDTNVILVDERYVVKPGCLKEALEVIREFHEKMQNLAK